MTQPSIQFDIEHVKLEQITIVKASINNEAEFSSLPQEAGFDIKFNITTAANLVAKKVRATFDCHIQAFEDEKRANQIGISGTFEIAYIFSIQYLAEMSGELDNGLINVPDDLVASLYNITYSTSRGIIYTRCLGTVLGKVILPIISTPKLIGKA